MTQPKMTAAELAERLKPTHLTGDTTAESLKEQIEEATQGPPPQSPEDELKNDPKAQNPYVFDFEWTDSRGHTWQGRFQTHMPTPLDIMRAGVMQSRLLGSAPKESLDAFTDEIAFMISRLSFCLDERPDWFTDPLSMVDGVPLIQAVYEEVAAYEAFFRRHGAVENKGKGQPR